MNLQESEAKVFKNVLLEIYEALVPPPTEKTVL